MTNLSPNYTPNRKRGNEQGKPLGICLHMTGGSVTSARAWFANPASQASSNLIMARTGAVIRVIRDADAAWTNGFKAGDKPTNKLCKEWLAKGLNANLYTLTIETEWKPEWGLIPVGSALYRSLVNEVAWWCKTYHIPVDRDHIFGHYELTQRKPLCGRHIPWADFIKDVKAIVGSAVGIKAGN